MKPYVDILGTRFKIEFRDATKDEYMKKEHIDGYCSEESNIIVIADLKILYPDSTEVERVNYLKHLLRHEVLHAFLFCSGLTDCAHRYEGAWAKNEEMVDWFAVQFPKILEAYKWLEIV